MTTDPRRRSRRRRAGGVAKPKPTAKPQESSPSPERAAERAAELARTPFVAVQIQTTGIHPGTAHIVTVDAVVYTAAGEPDAQFHAVINPGCDPGPQHLHGLSPAEVAAGKQFGSILKSLGKLIDGRTLITHNAPMVWGFVHKEARRAMATAARNNRNRSRTKNRRRQRVGHVPRPVSIVDTLATARRRGLVLPDTRVRTVARAMGIACEPATATLARARQPEAETTRAETQLIADMFFSTRDQLFAAAKPEDLAADRFGLQRSRIRVDAAAATPKFVNPGVFTDELVAGMQVVVAPEVEVDPDELIQTIVDHDLSYSEKVTRQTSLVVCNDAPDVARLTGKAMHATRKGIPLLADQEFLELVATTPVTPGELAPPPESSPVLRSITQRNPKRPKKNSRRRASGS